MFVLFLLNGTTESNGGFFSFEKKKNTQIKDAYFGFMIINLLIFFLRIEFHIKKLVNISNLQT